MIEEHWVLCQKHGGTIELLNMKIFYKPSESPIGIMWWIRRNTA